MMNADPNRLTFRTYQSVLSEWNMRHSDDPKKSKPKDYSRLKRAMDAHSIH